ncbi:hypothetical protein ACOME3_002599 [Neoechinorhynchus agilis]
MGPVNLDMQGTQIEKMDTLKYLGSLLNMQCSSATRMLCGAETWTTKEDVQGLAVNEMRMLRWSAGMTRGAKAVLEGKRRRGRPKKRRKESERRFRDAGKGEEQRRKPTMLKRTTYQVREKFKEMWLLNNR